LRSVAACHGEARMTQRLNYAKASPGGFKAMRQL